MSEQATTSACLLLIGNELLSGRTHDQNLPFLGRRLAELGIVLAEARVIADDNATIIRHVNECRADYDYVFTTGGIGPTHDDITAAAVADAFGVEIEYNQAAEEELRRFYGERVNESRLKMAQMPAGALLVKNPHSGAPGFQMDNVFVLAGIPSVMQAMFDALAPQLRHGKPIMSRTLKTDRRESQIAAGLARIQATYPDISVGSYPFFTSRHRGVNIVLRGTDNARLDQAWHELLLLIEQLGGECTDMTETGE